MQTIHQDILVADKILLEYPRYNPQSTSPSRWLDVYTYLLCCAFHFSWQELESWRFSEKEQCKLYNVSTKGRQERGLNILVCLCILCSRITIKGMIYVQLWLRQFLMITVEIIILLIYFLSMFTHCLTF